MGNKSLIDANGSTPMPNHTSKLSAFYRHVFIGIFLCMACLLLTSLAKGQALQSGQPILVGGNEGIGPLATISISSTPLGYARIFNGDRPDIFVSSDRWDPGFHLYRWMNDTKDGVPIFGQPIEVDTSELEQLEDHSLQDHAVAGYVFEAKDGRVFGIWVRREELVIACFDKEDMRFEPSQIVSLRGLPRLPRAATGRLLENGELELFLSVSDGVSYKPPIHHRDPAYRPFDGSGVWMGGIPRDAIYRTAFKFPEAPSQVVAREIVSHRDGGQFGINGMTILSSNRSSELVIGTLLGGFHSYSYLGSGSDEFASPKQPLVDEHGISLRHPQTWTTLIAYPSNDSGRLDLLASGEGGVYYYKRSGTIGNRLSFAPMGEVQQRQAQLHGGTLVVPTIVDWNGDGRLDIVAGNSQGHIQFFENVSSNSRPAFAPPKKLAAGGEIIFIQGAYASIQGPGEARWGYASPNVFDWNGDGLLDILMNDIRGVHSVYRNLGSKTEPKLASGRPIFLDDLDLRGTWRTRPGLSRIGGENIYITLDEDDQFHLYRQVDAYNVSDGGKLRLQDGSPISANFLHAGGRGRTKFEYVDWDGDGIFDLIVGTPRHGTVPVADQSGLPWSRNKAGSAVLLLRNMGTNEKPSFTYPRLMHHDGKPVHLGQHACSPAAAFFDREPDLIVGTETGKFIYYDRDRIQWK